LKFSANIYFNKTCSEKNTTPWSLCCTAQQNASYQVLLCTLVISLVEKARQIKRLAAWSRESCS
jgi:hypothetical protein